MALGYRESAAFPGAMLFQGLKARLIAGGGVAAVLLPAALYQASASGQWDALWVPVGLAFGCGVLDAVEHRLHGSDDLRGRPIDGEFAASFSRLAAQ